MQPQVKLDLKFLEELGLGGMPDEQKKAFLQHIYSELETRTGHRLTENMSDEMLDEFGGFVNKNVAKMKAWLSVNVPDYATQPDYQRLTQKAAGAGEAALLSEYGAMKWLQKNLPDYPQIVQATLEELKKEIMANKDQVLA